MINFYDYFLMFTLRLMEVDVSVPTITFQYLLFISGQYNSKLARAEPHVTTFHPPLYYP